MTDSVPKAPDLIRGETSRKKLIQRAFIAGYHQGQIDLLTEQRAARDAEKAMLDEAQDTVRRARETLLGVMEPKP